MARPATASSFPASEDVVDTAIAAGLIKASARETFLHAYEHEPELVLNTLGWDLAIDNDFFEGDLAARLGHRGVGGKPDVGAVI
jgi:hypothetical protein